jgi:hypothetical protein
MLARVARARGEVAVTEKPHWSPSRMFTFGQCGERYRRRYICGDKIPPAVAAHRGGSFHEAAQFNFEQKKDSHEDRPKGKVVDFAADAFDKRVATQGVLFNRDEAPRRKAVLGEAKDMAVNLVGGLMDQYAPSVQPLLVEEKVRIILPKSSHDLLGILDIVTANGVDDMKTSMRKKRQDEADTSTALSTYAMAHKVAVGTFPKQLRLVNFIHRGLTKTRTIPEVEVQPIQTTRTVPDLMALAKRMETTIRTAEAGNFPPAPVGVWWCSERFCGYWDTCPYVNSERKAASDAQA